MTNERLRIAMDRADVGVERLAHDKEVDPKTVQRWLTGRVPHPRHRWALVERLDEAEDFLWPDLPRTSKADLRAAAELVTAYGYRSEMDPRRWWDLFQGAEERIDLLGFTLYFLPQQHPGLVDLLQSKVASGCRLRVAIADPESPHVRWRDSEEHQAITILARIQSSLDSLRPLIGCEGAEFRVQEAPLYNSIFRFDEQMLVTPHLYAIPGHAAPLLHLRRLMSDGMFARFEAHFEGVWADARPMGKDVKQSTG